MKRRGCICANANVAGMFIVGISCLAVIVAQGLNCIGRLVGGALGITEGFILGAFVNGSVCAMLSCAAGCRAF